MISTGALSNSAAHDPHLESVHESVTLKSVSFVLLVVISSESLREKKRGEIEICPLKLDVVCVIVMGNSKHEDQ